MKAVLEDAGHTVDSRASGVSGLSWIDSKRPDCLITDLMMAEMDGLELCRQVRAKKELNRTKIIFVSGRGGDVWKKRAKDAGAQGYITKPIDPAAFVDQVMEILK